MKDYLNFFLMYNYWGRAQLIVVVVKSTAGIILNFAV